MGGKNVLVSRAAQKIIYINENDQKPHSEILKFNPLPHTKRVENYS